MDIIIEIIIEIFGEFFFEVIIALLSEFFSSKAISTFVEKPENKRILKITIYTISVVSSLTMLVLSIVYSKKVFSIIACGYVLTSIIIHTAKMLSIRNNKYKLGMALSIILLLARITCACLVFINLSSIESKTSRIAVMIVIISLLIIFMLVDLYKLIKNNEQKKTN